MKKWILCGVVALPLFLSAGEFSQETFRAYMQEYVGGITEDDPSQGGPREGGGDRDPIRAQPYLQFIIDGKRELDQEVNVAIYGDTDTDALHQFDYGIEVFPQGDNVELRVTDTGVADWAERANEGGFKVAFKKEGTNDEEIFSVVFPGGQFQSPKVLDANYKSMTISKDTQLPLALYIEQTLPVGRYNGAITLSVARNGEVLEQPLEVPIYVTIKEEQQ